MKSFFKGIKTLYGTGFFCSVGPYNDYPDCSVRFYLDEIKTIHPIDRFLIIHEKILSLLNACFEKSNTLTLVFSTSDEVDRFPIDDFSSLNDFGLNILKMDTEVETVFDPDDEWYMHYLAINVDKSILPRLVWGTLARHFLDIEPLFIPDLFIFSECNKAFANIYDDRGLDVVSLESELISKIKSVEANSELHRVSFI